jgi:DNA-binding CsgD family transcriptional regulator
MTMADVLERGRGAFGRHAWADAYAQLSAADHESSLEPDDIELMAITAHMLGRDVDSIELWERAHRVLLGRGDPVGAARCAIRLAAGLLTRGEFAPGGGWLARAARLLEDDRLECAERGHLLVPAAIQRIGEGDHAGAYAVAGQAAEIGVRFGDCDLMALARFVQGRALFGLGRIAEGVSLLDEAMVAVIAGEVSPVVAGMVYCGVIEGCQEVFDLRRAREWTVALTRWCDSQPDLVPYGGQCLVHRAEIMTLSGAWPDAADSAQLACERFLLGADHPAAGAAYYQCGELARLRGEFATSEQAYREASRRGREPQPGLALLRLAQDQVEIAAAAIQRVLVEARDRMSRARLLPAHVEITLAAQDVRTARVAVDELSEIAAAFDAPLLHAQAAHATGAVLLAEGDGPSALTALRRAWTGWQDLDAPYEAARARVLVGLACRKLGDADGAEMELDAARWVFQQLGAVPDLVRAQALSRKPTATTAGGLTAREVQVLHLVASGMTNRSIATELFLSEKTVARHLANIFTKLGLSSRAAATAYAYQHDIA